VSVVRNIFWLDSCCAAGEGFFRVGDRDEDSICFVIFCFFSSDL
jgi:hypothetical protein